MLCAALWIYTFVIMLAAVARAGRVAASGLASGLASGSASASASAPGLARSRSAVYVVAAPVQARSIGSVRVKNAAKWEALRAGGTLQRSVQQEGLVREVRKRARYEKPAVTRRRIKKNKKRKERQKVLFALYKRFEARKDAKVKNQMYKEGVV